MILLIDNYDSFSYNLYQLVGELSPDIKVIRNDEMTIEEIRTLKPKRIILSPGSGRRMRESSSKPQKHWDGKSPSSACASAIRQSARHSGQMSLMPDD